jgi:hypothetical protein
MQSQKPLHLYEEVMLLALRDEKGTIESGAPMYQYAIGGAILAELVLDGKLGVEERGKRRYAIAEDTARTGDELLDECVQKVRDAKRRQQLQTWVSRFSGVKKLKHRVAQNLVRKRILELEEGLILGLFTRKVYPEINPKPEEEIRERLRRAIFTDETDLDPRTVVLLSLAKNANLLKVAFPKKELKSRKKRIEAVVNGDVAGKATKEAIEAMQAAVFVATILPAITTTAATS